MLEARSYRPKHGLHVAICRVIAVHSTSIHGSIGHQPALLWVDNDISDVFMCAIMKISGHVLLLPHALMLEVFERIVDGIDVAFLAVNLCRKVTIWS